MVDFKSLFKGNAPKLDREPTLTDEEQLLAYMETLEHQRTPFQIKLHEEDLAPYSARVDVVSEAEKFMTLTLQRALDPNVQKKHEFFMVFTMDGQRFKTWTRYLERGEFLRYRFSLPQRIQFADRRGAMRARFASKELASVAILEGLFDGIGASGKLINVSMGGLCFRIDRAIQVQGGRRIPIGANLFRMGQNLVLIRIENLPNLPTLEFSGHVCHSRQTEGGVLVGVQFDEMGLNHAPLLDQLLAKRLKNFSKPFPRKLRAGQLEAKASEDHDASETEESEEASAESPLSQENLEEEAQDDRVQDKIRLMRKRGRLILLVVPDEFERMSLYGTLYVDGYRRILEASTLVQALSVCKQGELHALFVDQQVGPLKGLDLIQKLRTAGHIEMTVPTFLMVDATDVRTTLAARTAKVEIITKPIDWDQFFRDVLEKRLEI